MTFIMFRIISVGCSALAIMDFYLVIYHCQNIRVFKSCSICRMIFAVQFVFYVVYTWCLFTLDVFIFFFFFFFFFAATRSVSVWSKCLDGHICVDQSICIDPLWIYTSRCSRFNTRFIAIQISRLNNLYRFEYETIVSFRSGIFQVSIQLVRIKSRTIPV